MHTDLKCLISNQSTSSRLCRYTLLDISNIGSHDCYDTVLTGLMLSVTFVLHESIHQSHAGTFKSVGDALCYIYFIFL